MFCGRCRLLGRCALYWFKRRGIQLFELSVLCPSLDVCMKAVAAEWRRTSTGAWPCFNPRLCSFDAMLLYRFCDD